MKDYLRSGVPKGASWGGPSLTHIESRQRIVGETVSDAVVMVRHGFRAENGAFVNCAFVFEDADLADEFKEALPDVHASRVIVGGMDDAVKLLMIASSDGNRH